MKQGKVKLNIVDSIETDTAEACLREPFRLYRERCENVTH